MNLVKDDANSALEGVDSPLPRLRLRTAKETRASMARLMRAYLRGRIGDKAFSNLVYAFQGYLSYLKHELDEEVGARLDAIEQRLDDQKRWRNAR